MNTAVEINKVIQGRRLWYQSKAHKLGYY